MSPRTVGVVRLKPDTTPTDGDAVSGFSRTAMLDVVSGWIAVPGVVSGFSRTSFVPGAGSASRMSRSRDQLANPRWIMFVTQPNAIIGHASIARYALNATNS